MGTKHSTNKRIPIYPSKIQMIAGEHSCHFCGGKTIDWRNNCPLCRPYVNYDPDRSPESSPYYDYAMSSTEDMYTYADVGPRDQSYEPYMSYDGKLFIQKYRKQVRKPTGSVDSTNEDSVGDPYNLASLDDNTSKKDVYATIPADSTDLGSVRLELLDDTSIVHRVVRYRAIIESRINVDEVMLHMPFIGDPGVVSEINRYNPKAAMQALLLRIQSANEQSKWKMFLDALRAAGYEHIVGLLNGVIVEDNEDGRYLLRSHTAVLAQRLNPMEIVDELLMRQLISQSEKQEIICVQTHRGAEQAARVLLQKVPNRLTDWFEIFNKILFKHGVDPLMYDWNG